MNSGVDINCDALFPNMKSEIQDFINTVNKIAQKILKKHDIQIKPKDIRLEEIDYENYSWYSYTFIVNGAVETVFKLNCEFAEYFEIKSLSKYKGSNEVTFMFEPKEENNANSTH